MTKKHITVFAFIMLNVATVLNLKGLPLLAETNAKMIFYLMFSAVFFLLPCAFVAAELSSTFSKPGGIYHWVKTAFGSRIGVLAVWLQWMQNIIWVPTVLAFAADSFAYSINLPHLASNPTYTALMIVCMYWCAILITLRGLNLSSIITSIGAILGVLLPSLFLYTLEYNG